ncbi:MAG: GGDEF domain-containing protein, partial [Coriobacteriia bacterium]|nr:GGDEF domain-containing protein [Coriobacteriia bacterium]
LDNEKSAGDETSLPVEEIQLAADTLFGYLRDVLYAPKQAVLNPELLPEPFRDLAKGLLFIGKCIGENRSLSKELSQGKLDSTIKISSDNEIASGLKNLQATLKHISWQVGQIAKGDYNQRLHFAGMFSQDINDMIDQLKERDSAMRAEITLTQQLAEESRNAAHLLEGITKSIDELIIVVDRSTYEWLYTNHDPKQYIVEDKSIARVKAFLHEMIDGYSEDEEEEHEGTEAPLQSLIRLLGEDGSVNQIFSFAGYPITWMDRKSVVLKLVDVTEMERESEELKQVAFFDTLTRTYSRHYGMITLEKWIAEKAEFCIAFVDMDGLKYVNDTFGHIAGDEYILATSKLLTEFESPSIICRLGGDEFMLLLRNYSNAEADAVLKEMRNRLAEDALSEYDRSFSFGIVEVGKDNTKSASLLLSIADETMYEDKRSRKKERREGATEVKVESVDQ